jgi:chemotaxis protein histidine kinase CheA
MTGIPTLKPKAVSLRSLRDDNWFITLARLSSEPNAASFVAAYVTLGVQITATLQKQQDLDDAVVMTHAAVVAADNTLNVLMDQVSAAIHDGKKADPSLPLHILYFGSEVASEAKKPLLGPQLDMMDLWSGKLSQASKPTLVALAAPVSAAVDIAKKADDAHKAAIAARDKFKFDGELGQLFDAYNALAKSTWSGLGAYAEAHPDLNLRTDWPDSFFRHDSRNQTVLTVDQADEAVQKAKDALAEAVKVQAEAVATKAAADAAAEKQAKADEDVAEAKKATAEAKKKEKAAKEAAKKAKKG